MFYLIDGTSRCRIWYNYKALRKRQTKWWQNEVEQNLWRNSIGYSLC